LLSQEFLSIAEQEHGVQLNGVIVTVDISLCQVVLKGPGEVELALPCKAGLTSASALYPYSASLAGARESSATVRALGCAAGAALARSLLVAGRNAA